MPQFGRTWWGQRFIEELERFTDTARLGRGRTYAHGGRILDYQIGAGKVTARVRGSINPYFGVYKEPIYSTVVQIKPISPANWTTAIAKMSSKASFVAKLLMNEMPDTIEEAFASENLHLLPHSRQDFTTSCSCPDYSNPCKHIAGLCYILASALDLDPFLMFELRGLARDRLRAELATTPLGQILATELTTADTPLAPVRSFFTQPTPQSTGEKISYQAFWTGPKRLPPLDHAASAPSVPALLIKKQGDYPPFWPKDASFIATMEELYERVRTKSSQLK